MSTDLQPCPTCATPRTVLYTWRDGVMMCWCLTCGALFPLPRRDERAAQARALETIRDVAQKVPK